MPGPDAPPPRRRASDWDHGLTDEERERRLAELKVRIDEVDRAIKARNDELTPMHAEAFRLIDLLATTLESIRHDEPRGREGYTLLSIFQESLRVMRGSVDSLRRSMLAQIEHERLLARYDLSGAIIDTSAANNGSPPLL